MDYKVLGVSAAMGVSLHPFGPHVIGNIESRAIFQSQGDRQWNINFKGIPLWKKEYPTNLEPDVVIGSPDCGSGSILRMSRAKEYGNHKENKSLALFMKGVDQYNPKFFLFENLDGLFKSFPEEEFDAAFPNYRLVKHVASVAQWGNSQLTRVRLIVVGIRKDLPKKIDKRFKLPNYRDRMKTCFELYGDLDEPKGLYKGSESKLSTAFGHMREATTSPVTMYGGYKTTLGDVKKEWNTTLKGSKRYIADGRKYKTAPGVYRNTKLCYPATARKAQRQFDHNGLVLTPRQLARIQGVPDDFRIYLSVDKLNYWLNKARAAVTKTPPYEISVWFKRKLEKTYNLWK
jgi:site-specific DNA-cytosine methylase